jgi:hypothetical protein
MAKRPDLPDLRETGRRYVENTRHTRLASPGIERYASRPGRRHGAMLAVVVLGAAIVAAMLWFTQ